MKREDWIPFEQVLEEDLRDPEFRAEWERLAPARALAIRLVGYRIDHDLTQSALGRLLGMSQPAIARLESGDHLPTLPTLLKLSEALGIEISVAMTPPNHDPEQPTPDRPDRQIVERVTTPRGASMVIAIR
jgi:DNA-binding XRE family transcriptional regulator